MEYKKCGMCGGEFPKEHFYKKGNGLDYRCKKCSNEQRSNNIRKQSERGELKKWNSNPLKKKCLICGDKFETKINRKLYCSNECRLIGAKERSAKEFDSKYIGYKHIHRDGRNVTYMCLECGSEYTVPLLRLSKRLADGMIGPRCEICEKQALEKELTIKRQMAEQTKEAKRKEKRIERQHQAFMKEEKHKVWKIYSNHRYYLKCEECGRMFFYYTGRRKTCSERCSRKRKWKRTALSRDKRIRLNGNIDWSISLSKLIERDGGVCHICGKQCSGNDIYINDTGYYVSGDKYPSIDHVKPISKGGTHTWDNVKLAHRLCNSLKCDSEHYTDKKN